MRPTLIWWVALSVVGCGGPAFDGAPGGDDGGDIPDGAPSGPVDGSPRADGAAVDAGGGDARGDAPDGTDAAPADATASDASAPDDASSDMDVLGRLPDAGHALAACETCLETDCSAAVANCEANTYCSETVQCVIASGCFGADAGIDACIMTCETTEGLTPGEKVQVTMEVLAMSTCAPPCASMCSAGDAGGH